MAHYEYVILTQAVEGQLEEFERWYDEVHLGDVLKVPGIVAAKRSRIISQEAKDLAVPAWSSLAIYEMETDDPQKVIAAVKAVSSTAAMPLSDALSRFGLIQMVAQPVSRRP